MSALLGAIFIASLVGSLHCAGMCGGVVALCVGGEPLQRRSWLAPASYHGGRLVAYAAMGAAAGALGAAFDLGGAALGVQRLAPVAAGAAMILIGASAILPGSGRLRRCMSLPRPLACLLRRGMAAATRRPAATRGFLIGLLSGLLPCGWLWAFVAAAAGTGSGILGAACMAVFWAGTVPILLALSVGLRAVMTPLRRHAPRLAALGLIGVGAATILLRLDVPACAIRAADEAGPGDLTRTRQRVEDLRHTPPPCCDEHARRPG
jgi:hypothetical protein